MGTRLKVSSEIGSLKKVLVHNPGEEIDTMVPEQMQELLFDDILFGTKAREEHRIFREILGLKAKVYDIQDLLIEAISTETIKNEIFQNLQELMPLNEECKHLLEEFSPKSFALALVQGVRSLSGDRPGSFLLNSVPNLLFMRDPLVVIQDQIILNSMFARARIREPFLLQCIFNYHPKFKTKDFHEINSELTITSPFFDESRPTIEGGDILVLSEEVIFCGASQRTNRLGIEYLADLLKEYSTCKTLMVCELPVQQRAFMHLDTIFTQINHHEFLAYPRMIGSHASQEIQVYSIDLGKKGISYKKRGSMVEALDSLGIEATIIPCGGNDEISQQREQWTDASNAFTLAPGVIITYACNVRTAEELSKAGYEIIPPEDYKRSDLVLDGSQKIAFQINSMELGRARGGPRCMTMPLERASL
jgi:arginine deiminase